jgi:tetraacyldisaccharide-1-P 4'-kinase
VMTSKDAVKCEAFAGSHCWYLEVEARLAPTFSKPLLTALRALLDARDVHP